SELASVTDSTCISPDSSKLCRRFVFKEIENGMLLRILNMSAFASCSFFPSLAFALLFATGIASAFPPAPYYTLYGMVRDQVGQTVNAEGAVVILLKGGVEVGRTPITSNRLDQSYELNLRIDQNRSGTTFYTDKAVAAGGLFSLVVSMNGEFFYPIEVSGNLTAGKGGERVKLDLTLGEDKDKDGLPDTWEAWQLYQAGLYPDENGEWDLSLIDKNGDFDKDVQSNLFEYIAGTFAGDATETFGLTIKEKLPESVRFEFYGITGKVYTIESSLDMKTWTRVPFAVGAPGAGSNAHQASDVGIVSAFTAPRSSSSEFYRLSVR
ncbi:MAG: hypothetical protein RLZZ245_3924, partial [Verrucomicrobiota bacterium]